MFCLFFYEVVIWFLNLLFVFLFFKLKLKFFNLFMLFERENELFKLEKVEYLRLVFDFIFS